MKEEREILYTKIGFISCSMKSLGLILQLAKSFIYWLKLIKCTENEKEAIYSWNPCVMDHWRASVSQWDSRTG